MLLLSMQRQYWMLIGCTSEKAACKSVVSDVEPAFDTPEIEDGS